MIKEINMAAKATIKELRKLVRGRITYIKKFCKKECNSLEMKLDYIESFRRQFKELFNTYADTLGSNKAEASLNEIRDNLLTEEITNG
jgi:hypothetical protein